MGNSKRFSIYLLCFFNVICVLIGFATIMIGVSYESNLSGFLANMEHVHSVVTLTPTLLMALGIVVFATAFFGCCATLRGNSCMLMTYAIVLIVIWILQISWISYIFVQIGDDTRLKQNLYQALERLFESDSELANETIDYIQENLRCCGMGTAITRTILSTPTLPGSCCSSIINDVCIPFEQGCWQEFYNLIGGRTNGIAIAIGILALIKLLGATVAIYVAKSDKKSTNSI